MVIIDMGHSRRMAAHWPLVIFHNIIEVSSYNFFVIWREINPNWMLCKRHKRRVFLEQLEKALVHRKKGASPQHKSTAVLV